MTMTIEDPISQSSLAPIGTDVLRVLIAEDHQVTLWGLEQLLMSVEPPAQVLGTASTVHALLTHPQLPLCDVVLLDLGLRDGDAMDCLQRLTRQQHRRVVVITGDTDPLRLIQCVRRGASGIVLKSEPLETVVNALRQVVSGGVWIEPNLLDAAARANKHDDSVDAPHPVPVREVMLTPKEREVVRAVVNHRGAKGLVLALALQMSESTLRNHLTVIYQKLGVRGKLELYLRAMELGLVDPAHANATMHPNEGFGGRLR